MKRTIGWRDDIAESKAYVMHFLSRGKAAVVVRGQELKVVAKAAGP